MNTITTHIQQPPPRSAGNPRGATRSARRPHSETSALVGVLGADLALIGIVPFGLPSVMLLGGWTFLALALAGPFLTLAVIVLAMLIVAATTAAIVALPYLIVRSLHRYRARRPSRRPLIRRERHPQGSPPPSAAQLPGAVPLKPAVQLHTNAHP